ncbi:DUF1045 domain-containing protein [Chromobacterium haemolyticum]|uniref:DUF1045 domain-containing protein n=1 Tax=Chromobacterium haemolyticum TaxID=394935 RepID=A0ABS3GIE5_9NEIS|nr:DUF1045 domain-containing protein [Chromobacterium haemolyticum]MBK0413720.1 DUF1045 domain-containing protein [Chromobacterium haemolyticum]MBO0414822.1 DUF1045 domain-containing protein [Chromobacterium haemolyticum]MBO0498083.1 DUF1045 domain-containing protein [Chromobacterium haemolyticum]MDH0342511.1 DUF1045 domain-containing protein [Chromobacterium haemolyticum]OQS35546.1 hypothetical protein B0T40_12435 [Chromobacterium haemolyticum]
MRYALYYAPRPDSAFWRAGSGWLGQDAHSGLQVLPPHAPGLDAETWAELTAAPARYGWHATLKAPFSLRAGVDEEALLARTAVLARRFQPFELSLEVAWLADFLALRPMAPPPDLAELAAACVVELEALADRESPWKVRAGLDARQERLQRRWGYPYVFEQYRFHLTLSGRLTPDSAEGRALEQAARRHFAAFARAWVDGVAVFVETAAGEPFRYLAHCGFDGQAARYEA